MRNTLFALALLAGCQQPAATTTMTRATPVRKTPPTRTHEQWAEALADLEVAAKADQKSGVARLDLANGLIDSGIDFLRELDGPPGPTAADYLDRLWTRARAELRRAVELDPDLRYQADMARKRIPHTTTSPAPVP